MCKTAVALSNYKRYDENFQTYMRKYDATPCAVPFTTLYEHNRGPAPLNDLELFPIH